MPEQMLKLMNWMIENENAIYFFQAQKKRIANYL